MSSLAWLGPLNGISDEVCAGTLFTERGTIVTVFIVCYALTSFVAGYIRCACPLVLLSPAGSLKSSDASPAAQLLIVLLLLSRQNC